MPAPLSLKPREYRSQPAAALLGDLSVSPLGLRFTNARTEDDYKQWHARTAVPFVRFGLMAATAAWAGALIAIGLAGAARTQEAVLLVLGLNTPFIGGAFALTLLRAHAHRAQLAAMAANTASGLTACLLAFWLVNEPLISTTGVIGVSFFGFTVFRARARIAVVASAPYVVTAVVLLVRAGPGAARTQWLTSWVAVLVMWCVCIFIGFLNEALNRRAYVSERTIEEQRLALDRERRRADELLRSVLPATIAERLKRSPGVIAERFDRVTVLFADLVGFTPLAAGLSPEAVVGLLDAVFTRFDELAAQHGVEKVKTMGDAYMAVAGAPTPVEDDAGAVARLALAMCAEVSRLAAQTGHPLSLRIGIASGPAVAGVIGAQKFAWDLWGDTVNTASRMQTHGVVDRVQLAESTYQRLAGRFTCEPRGEIDVKGKGPMPTWLLVR